MKTRLSHARRGMLLLPLALASRGTWAQPADRPLRIVTPFQAGTGSDTLLRVASKYIAEDLGRPVVIDNKPGADGIIAVNDFLGRPADGLTVLAAANTSTSGIVALRKNPPFDPVASFASVAQLGYFTVYLYVSTQSNFRSVRDVVAFAKANPGELKSGTSGVTTRFATAQLAQIGNVEIVDVPFKGEPAVLSEIVENRIQMAFASGAVLMPLVEAGRLRVLATIMQKRTKFAPSVPTMAEEGFSGFNTAGWAGIFAQKQISPDTRDRLARAFNAGFAHPAVGEAADKMGFMLNSMTPADMDRLLVNDIAVARRLVASARMEMS